MTLWGADPQQFEANALSRTAQTSRRWAWTGFWLPGEGLRGHLAPQANSAGAWNSQDTLHGRPWVADQPQATHSYLPSLHRTLVRAPEVFRGLDISILSTNIPVKDPEETSMGDTLSWAQEVEG